MLTHAIRFFLDGNVIDTKTGVPDGSRIAPPEDRLLKGYDVISWRVGEENGSEIWSFPYDAVYENLDLYADFRYGIYTVTLVDGEFDEPSVTYYVAYAEDYDFSDIFQTNHYHVSGWKDEDGNSFPVAGKWTIPGSATLHAVWEATNFKIRYDLNGGGSNDPANPTSYNARSGRIKLKPATRCGYRFLGWMYNQEYIDAVDSSFYGDLVLTAAWERLYALDVTADNPQCGSVSIIKGYSYNDVGDTIEVKAAYAWGCSFKGWYKGDELVSCDEFYSFPMPAEDCILTAKFWSREETLKSWGINPVFNPTNNTMAYGLYPQTHVTSEIILEALELLTTKEIDGWHLLNGDYYAKVTASKAYEIRDKYTGRPYTGKRTFDDGEEIIAGTNYWFKCEPIQWKVLSSKNNEYSLLSGSLLDARHFHSSITSKTPFFDNNYMSSEIRSWLNNDFYNLAFYLNDSNIQSVVVDNSAATTRDLDNKYVCSDTEDKVYFLSYQDYLNTEFGFSADENDSTRKCKTSDWARANGATGYDFDPYAFYWTRSPRSTASAEVECIDGYGCVHNFRWIDVGDMCGVRPRRSRSK